MSLAEKSGDMYSYTVFGLEVCSEMPIPELVESKGEPDVIVRLGSVDRSRPDGAKAGQHFWATPDECCIFEDEVATFHVRAGREITVDPAPGVAERILRSYLVG